DRFDPSAGTFAHFRHDPAQPASLSNDLVMSLHVDGQGAVWAGTLGSGLDRLDPRTGTITHFPPDPAAPLALADGNVTAIASDAAGRLWVGTFAGLHRLDPGAAGFVRYAAEPARPAALSHAQVVSLLPAPDGSLWIGTWGGGLNRLDLNDPASLDPAAARFTRYQHVAGDPASLSEDSVWAIHRTADGRLWLGTQGGLNRFDPATGAFRAYREAEGLRNATVLGVMEDAAGALWVTTNNGLARFDPQVERFTLYDSSDGLASNEFNSGAWLRTRAGQLYVGGGRGFNVFEPAALQPGRLPPPVALTDFKIFNTSVRRAPAAPITLAHDQDFIAFEFAALDYSAPARNVYAYQLEGYDADWIQAGPRRYASYTNLPGGSYTLRVRAANGDGVWNEAGLAVPVTVTPPIWETWWFRGLGLAALALAGFGLFQARVYTIRAQNRQLESVVRVRTAELEETNRRLAREVEQRQRAEAALARRAAQELEQAEARFRVMFEHSAIGMGLLALDRRLLQVNPAVCRMSGYSPAELLALDPVRLWPAEENGLDAALFRELAAGQRETYAFERRFVRKDGSGFWGRLNYSLVRGADGAPQYIFGTLENIDAQRAALAELTASEARFRAVFESASVGVALMGLDRRVFSANLAAQRLTGYSAEELRQINTSDLAVEADRALGRAEFEDLVAGRRDQYLLEKRYRRKDGSVYWGRVNFSAVRDAAGGVQYLAGLIEDITETKEAEARLAAQAAEAQRTLERRIAERTAELNQANALLQQKAAQEAVASERTRLARDLHDAVTQTLFAATLIAEVLPQVWRQSAAEGERRLEELRQLTRGALAEMRTLLVELRPNALVEIPLGALLRQLTEAVTGRARLPIQLSVEGDRALPADVQVALYRIAQEALNNAVKHARASQAFVTARLGPVVRLTIADNGAGFDAAAVPAGHLGLQIMRERAESVGAKFSLYSERGEGTQISVTWEAGT
ncbi:MAG: PAS domain S-box protein, partial [Anaerolineales bacterium]|nr:PAS domain S-box protein [Anaerolineales bacterium]